MRLRLIAAFVAVGLAASACTSSTSGEPVHPRTSGSSSTPAPVTSTPTAKTSAPTSPPPTVPTTGPNVRPGEKPPSIPPLASSASSEGAASFAEYWFRTIDWAYATTTSALTRSAFSSSCTDCKRFLRVSIDRNRELGRHFVGGRIYFESLTPEPNDGRWGAKAVDDVTVGQHALKVVSRSGKVVERSPAVQKLTFRLWLGRTSKSWTVVGWKTVKRK